MTIKDYEVMIERIPFIYEKNGADRKKKDFLKSLLLETAPEDISENTIELYIYVLKNIVDKEEYQNGMEWCDFSKTMVDSKITNLEAKSPVTLYSYISIIKTYLIKTTPQGDVSKTGYDYTMGLDIEELKKFINQAAVTDRYISYKQFKDIVANKRVDAGIKALIVLLWHGIKGINYDDVLSLTVDKIDLENKKIYREDGSILWEIPQEYIKVFQDAMETNDYKYYDSTGNLVQEKGFYTYEQYEMAGKPKWFIRRMPRKRVKEWFAKPDITLVSTRVKDMRAAIGNQYIDSQSIHISGDAYRILEMNGFQPMTRQDWTIYREMRPESKISLNTAKLACDVILEKINKGE